MDDRKYEGVEDADVKVRLTFDEERGVLTSPHPVLREVVKLEKELSRTETQELYRQYIRKQPSKVVPHPDIAENLNLNSTENMSEFWNMVAETIPEDPDYKEIAESWIKSNWLGSRTIRKNSLSVPPQGMKSRMKS